MVSDAIILYTYVRNDIYKQNHRASMTVVEYPLQVKAEHIVKVVIARIILFGFMHKKRLFSTPVQLHCFNNATEDPPHTSRQLAWKI